MDPQSGASQDQIIGQTVGNYLVTQKLGEGGMGSVYLAEHPTIGKKVALKILHAEFSSNPEVAERFFTEAKSVNAIGHPNIVDIVDYGVLQTGPAGRDRLVYFIMEFLAGKTLSDVVRSESPLPPERALTIALQVADALAASHKTGIVHRDLKPDNIILIKRGRDPDFVKLLDFGIAKLTGSDGMSSHKTKTGLVLGTPAYMSPEQCEGRATVDHRTDVYALGVVLYEMLVGRVPFIGEGYGEILVQHLTAAPIPPSQYRMMSPHVEAVVLKALEKRPDMRYPNMDEFMRAMTDPVGYVEAHGGVGGFAGRQLMPSTAPLPSGGVRLTPGPFTPVPGQLHSPIPGMLTAGMAGGPTPTTLSAAAGQVQPSKSKTPFFIAAGLVVVLAGGAIAFLSSKKSSNTVADQPDPDTGSEKVVNLETGSATKPPDPPPNTGSATQTTNGSAAGTVTPPNTGSAAVTPPNTGSATVPNNGKGSATEVTINKGSAAVEAQTASLTLTSVPDGSDIYINGKLLPGKKTPTTLTLPKGDYKISLTKKGFAEFKTKISLKSDAQTVDATLKAGGGGPAIKNTGKGSGSKQCDTCLERPD
jgi:eukaryotic-like serine/threonine-protein kinase